MQQEQNLTYGYTSNPGGDTVITRSDGQSVTLTGNPELRFLRELAYLSCDRKMGFDEYAAKVKEIAGKYFEWAL